MKTNSALNIITGIFAVLFCVVFVITALCTAVIGSLSACITTDGITEMVTSIDYTELLRAEGSENVFDELGLEDEAVNDIMKSDAAEEVISSVAEGITAGLTGNGSYEGLTADDIKNIAESNMDEIIAIAKENSAEEFDESELRSEITEVIDESAEELAESLPDADEIKAELISDIDSESLAVISFIAEGKLTLVLAGIAAAALVIICVIRIWNFSGFIFAGIASVVTTVLISLLTAAVYAVRINSSDIFGKDAVMFTSSMLGMINTKLLTCAVITAVAAAMLITAFVLLRKFVYNKRQRNAA